MKPLTTIQAKARAAFDEKFGSATIVKSWGYEECFCGELLECKCGSLLKSFLDTQLSLAHAAGYREGVIDGETKTKNGVGRYMLGFKDGEAKGREGAVNYLESVSAIASHQATKKGIPKIEFHRIVLQKNMDAARLPHTEEKN